MHSLLGEKGFITEYFEDVSDTQLGGVSTGSTISSSTPNVSAQVQLSLSVYVDNLAQKAENATRSLQEGQIRFVRGVFCAK
jgi:hypothetical protein